MDLIEVVKSADRSERTAEDVKLLAAHLREALLVIATLANAAAAAREMIYYDKTHFPDATERVLNGLDRALSHVGIEWSARGVRIDNEQANAFYNISEVRRLNVERFLKAQRSKEESVKVTEP